jgi:hypothetical protein
VRLQPALGSWWSACTWTKGQTAGDKGKGRGHRRHHGDDDDDE